MRGFVFMVLFFLFVTFTYSQEKEKKTTTYLEEGIFKNSLVINTKLSGKWSFENKLQISYTNYFNQIEIPITLKFQATDKLSFFMGPKINYLLVTDVYNMEPYKNFSIMAQVGVRYDLAKDFYGEIKYEYDLMNNKNNYNLQPSKGNLKFGTGIKF